MFSLGKNTLHRGLKGSIEIEILWVKTIIW